MKGQNESLKVSSLLSLHFFFLLYGFLFFFSTLEEKDVRKKRLKQKDKSEKAKGGAKSERA